MLDSARLLAAAGAELAICPDNSAHLAWDDVQAETPIPWLHIGREVAAEAARRGHRRVGVLGTRFTMDGPIYRDMLAAVGIETVVPEPDDFETVDRIIFSELVDGVFTDESRKAYNEVIAPPRRAWVRRRRAGLHGDPVAGATRRVAAADARLDAPAGGRRARAKRSPDAAAGGHPKRGRVASCRRARRVASAIRSR